jgi:hypothetical protein
VFKVDEDSSKPSSWMADARTGQILWSTPANGDNGRGVSDDIWSGSAGAESWSAAADGVRNPVRRRGRQPQARLENFLAWWDGDTTRELLDGTHIDKYGTSGRHPAADRAGVHSNNSTKSTPSLSGDLFGDWREEVIWPTTDNTGAADLQHADPDMATRRGCHPDARPAVPGGDRLAEHRLQPAAAPAASDRSRTRAANAAARPAYRGSSRSRSAYSFIDEPQPAAFTTTCSTPARSKVSMSRRAKPCASASRPLCTLSAPQQPCAGGTTTSQPSAASTRIVAAFTSGKNARCTQPVSTPTTARRVPRRRHPARRPRHPGQPRRQRFQGGQRRRQAGQQAAAADQPLHPGPLVRPQRAPQQAQPPGVREQREDRRPQRPLSRRPGMPALDLRAGVLGTFLLHTT